MSPNRSARAPCWPRSASTFPEDTTLHPDRRRCAAVPQPVALLAAQAGQEDPIGTASHPCLPLPRCALWPRLAPASRPLRLASFGQESATELRTHSKSRRRYERVEHWLDRGYQAALLGHQQDAEYTRHRKPEPCCDGPSSTLVEQEYVCAELEGEDNGLSLPTIHLLEELCDECTVRDLANGHPASTLNIRRPRSPVTHENDFSMHGRGYGDLAVQASQQIEMSNGGQADQRRSVAHHDHNDALLRRCHGRPRGHGLVSRPVEPSTDPALGVATYESCPSLRRVLISDSSSGTS